LLDAFLLSRGIFRSNCHIVFSALVFAALSYPVDI
jgi:hypothetical protein